MQKIKKIFLTLLVAAALLSTATVAFADEAASTEQGADNVSDAEIATPGGDDVTTDTDGTSTGGDSVATSQGSTVSDAEIATPESDSNATGTDDTATDTNIADENFFVILYDEFMEHADDVFALLAFIGTLIVGVSYKKGLLPMITRTTLGIKDAVERARSATSDQNADTRGALTSLDEKLTAADGKVTAICDRMATLESELSELRSDKDDRAAYKLILKSQVDMLYDIFMASAIPQYQKDAVGARICQMREELGVYDLSEK